MSGDGYLLLSVAPGTPAPDDSVLVWSEGTTWDAATQDVVLNEGRRFALGTEETAAGDPIDDLLHVLGPEGARAVEVCGGVGGDPGSDRRDGRAVRLG
ncbi:MAG: hypothetical protein ACRYF3_02225 [Janthinobacterium lividum]